MPTSEVSDQQRRPACEQDFAGTPRHDALLPALDAAQLAKAQRALENSAYVRKLISQRQPEFAAALASAAQCISRSFCR